jgi:hypothetical protein
MPIHSRVACSLRGRKLDFGLIADEIVGLNLQ